MSSATAMQPAVPAVSQRQYQSPPSSREQYYQQPAAANSASSTRRSARPSNATSPHTPTQASPAESSSASMTPRAVAPPSLSSTTNSPAGPVTGPPIAPPPRTSSNSRSNSYSGNQDLGRSGPASAHSASGYSNDNSTPSSSTQVRRKGYASPADQAAPSPRNATRSAQSPGQSGSSHDVARPPMGSDLPRDNSTVINRLVITDPEVDIAREQERIAGSQPIYTDGSVTTPRSAPPTAAASEHLEDSARSSRTRQEKSERRPKEMRFGEYILGQTLGEGEFGKVKMGWKRDGGVQVAIKLIRRDTLGNNPSRLPKIYREIAILRGLQHPNIVRLHEMVETERHIGIILEYASGGELFDYILQHRFLKDNSARRLFAQLVSGVGYLHKKGIVHRDLKLENLLLDRNRNIIITDFGFANTFNSGDELSEEAEYNLGNKDYVRKAGLDVVHDDGHRMGDLMQTSCGSPCYAAPELVVSDSLYTGRKVDVWSCGVILYAMLAGYLPFDDDPANPEGDNINLLYKYIVSTPLTFPEYVTPHARDLLKRILVPDPRKRADLFEVARHSWLSEYAHVVAFITSSTTTPSDISNTTVPSEDRYDQPHLARSASVREPSKAQHAGVSQQIGGLQKQGQLDKEQPKTTRDAKRRTVQVEYVAPASSTSRGDQSRTRARSDAQGPVEVSASESQETAPRSSQRTSAVPTAMPPPSRPTRDQVRAASEYVPPATILPVGASRPSMQGSLSQSRLPSRGNSYGQPAVAVATDTAQGRFSQPRGKQYNMTSPVTQHFGEDESAHSGEPHGEDPKRSASKSRHKRSSTMGEIGEKLFGKRGSFFGGKDKSDPVKNEKPPRSHPPVSMKQPITNDAEPRRSTDSRRTSFSFSRKNTTQDGSNRSSRRFSFLPSSLSNSFGGGSSSSRTSTAIPPKTADSDHSQHNRYDGRPKMAFGQGASRSPSLSTTGSTIPVLGDPAYDRTRRESPMQSSRLASSYGEPENVAQHNRLPEQPQQSNDSYNTEDTHFNSDPTAGYYSTSRSQPTHPPARGDSSDRFRPLYPSGFNHEDQENESLPPSSRKEKAVLQKPHRQFPDGGEKGGKAKRVMDFFRMRAKVRGGE